ncbi:MAG: hypothetical protein Q7T80_09350 [Methanoregula sp.]|nr:hypothetical protein [Methanoregula sp.]
MKSMKIIMSIIIVMICIVGLIFLTLQTTNKSSLSLDQDYNASGIKPDGASADSGKPCTSNEEWHQKADEKGFWIGGILVNQSMDDQEIVTILGSHNVSNLNEIQVSQAHYIGYYITAPVTQNKSLIKNLTDPKTTWNISFSSQMFAFVKPEVKKQNDRIETPVFLDYSPNMGEDMLFQNLISRNIPVMKTKIVRFGPMPGMLPQEKERLMSQINTDSRVLFTFKEYLEGDIC